MEGGFRPPTPCPHVAVGPDRTKLWHPLGAPDAFPPHAGGRLGSKRVLDIMSGPSANLNPVAEILLASPRKSRFGTPPEPCRSRTQPRARCPRGRLRLPCTPTRSAGGRGRRAPSVSWICSRAFLRRFCPPRPQFSPKFHRKEPEKPPRGAQVVPRARTGAAGTHPGSPDPGGGLCGAAGL